MFVFELNFLGTTAAAGLCMQWNDVDQAVGLMLFLRIYLILGTFPNLNGNFC